MFSENVELTMIQATSPAPKNWVSADLKSPMEQDLTLEMFSEDVKTY